MKNFKKSDDNLDWIFDLKKSVLNFLIHQNSKLIPGYFKFSYTGDFFNESIKWNVASSVFALKIFYTLGIKKNQTILNTSKYIKSFIKQNSTIYDDLIFKKGFFRNFLISGRDRNFYNLFNQAYINAETRQAYSSLLLYDEVPDTFNLSFPDNVNDIESILNKLNWNNPWSSGSHFSHILFFNNLAFKNNFISQEKYNENIIFTTNWINKLQNSVDGGWYSGQVPERLIINGAMKIITGLNAINSFGINYPEKLIDLCLQSIMIDEACDHFNIIYVLYYCSSILNRSYRQNEIEYFCLSKISEYKKFYKPEGGFSFFPSHSAIRYFGVKITQGVREPDMHGTVIFLWSISIISKILNIDQKLNFRVFRS